MGIGRGEETAPPDSPHFRSRHPVPTGHPPPVFKAEQTRKTGVWDAVLLIGRLRSRRCVRARWCHGRGPHLLLLAQGPEHGFEARGGDQPLFQALRLHAAPRRAPPGDRTPGPRGRGVAPRAVRSRIATMSESKVPGGTWVNASMVRWCTDSLLGCLRRTMRIPQWVRSDACHELSYDMATVEGEVVAQGLAPR